MDSVVNLYFPGWFIIGNWGAKEVMAIEGRILNPLVSLSDLMAFGTARYVIDGVGARAPSARVQAGEGANSAHAR